MATSYKQAQKHLADLETVLWLLRSNYLLSARKKLNQVTVRLPLVHWRETAMDLYTKLTIMCYNHTHHGLVRKKVILEELKQELQQFIDQVRNTA